MALNNISLYWKCQFIGWMLFAVWAITLQLFVLNFDQRSNPQFLKFLFIRLFISIALGITLSHFTRWVIRKLGLLKGSIRQQLASILLVTLLFTFLYGFFQSAAIDLADIFYVSEISVQRWGVVLFRLMGNFLVFLIWVLLYFGYHYIEQVKSDERGKLQYEKQLLLLEGSALRSQMNPHFIFNCLNSIKAMIQQNENEKSIEFLVLFAKLIRRIFNNADKRQVCLYDEIENCKLYTTLESLRLNDNLQFRFDIAPSINLKSIMVPSLIIQPFIENAIWHGIVPKEKGTVSISIRSEDTSIICEIDDDGIGRELSIRNKSASSPMHESSAIKISRERLRLERMLNSTDASLEIIDKYHELVPCGTRVVLQFKMQ